MDSVQIGSPAPGVLCFPLAEAPFQRTQLADFQIFFSIISALIISSVPWGKWPWMYPFSLPIHLIYLPRNSYKFQLHFPLSHLDDLITETSSHEYMVSIELSGTPYTANKIPRVSRVRGKTPQGTPRIENFVFVAAKTKVVHLRGKSYQLRLGVDIGKGISGLHLTA